MSCLDLFYTGKLKEIVDRTRPGADSAAVYDVCDGQIAVLSALIAEETSAGPSASPARSPPSAGISAAACPTGSSCSWTASWAPKTRSAA